MDSGGSTRENAHQSEMLKLIVIIKSIIKLNFLDFQYKSKINRDGYFVVKSELTRFQYLNLADALERVRNIIRELEDELIPKEVSPEKLAEIQRRHEKAARERLFIKRNRSQVKADRQVG